jgi:hypothetical protein
MFAQLGMVVLTAGLLAAALGSPAAAAEDVGGGSAPKATPAAPAQPRLTADAKPAALETTAQALGMVGLERSSRATDKLAGRIAVRTPVQPP